MKKHQRRFTGFDDKILSMYARSMSVRDIQAYLSEIYGTHISPRPISTVTDALVDEVATSQGRPLDPVWPIIYLDAIVMKARDQGVVQNKHVYMALGINVDGKEKILDLWIEPNKGATIRLKVITVLRNRVLADVFVIYCDGLKGFLEAIAAVFPRTIVQTCIVHLIRSSTRFVAWVNRKALIADLRLVYGADTEDASLAALAAFEKKRMERYPMEVQAWRSNWERARPFFAFGKEVRRIIYTTNAIESLNFTPRKVTKARGHFPSDEAALTLVYLGIHNMEKKWTRQPKCRNLALNQFSIMFEGRLPARPGMEPTQKSGQALRRGGRRRRAPAFPFRARLVLGRMGSPARPSLEWEEARGVLAAIDAANFLAGGYVAWRDNLSNATLCPGAIGHPFLHLRLGQWQYELGASDRAADELTRAYMGGGVDLVANEDPKDIRFLQTRAKAVGPPTTPR